MEPSNQSGSQGNANFNPSNSRPNINQVSPMQQSQTQQPQMQPVIGPDGKFVLGQDGRPVMRQVGGPGGSHHHQQMTPVLGSDGKPVIGPNGQPLMRPAGHQMQPVVGPDGKFVLGADGRPLMRPVGGPGGMAQQQMPTGGPGGRPQQNQNPSVNSSGTQDNNKPHHPIHDDLENVAGMDQNPKPRENLIQQNNPGINRQALEQQRFLNPTGQARFTAAQNPALQNANPNANAGGTYQDTQQCWGQFCGFITTYICCCCCDPPYKLVPEGTTGVIQRFGKFYKLVPPGMHYLNPELDQLILVDKREQVFILKKQVVQTRDNVTITIDAILYYKVVDSYKSKFAVNNLIGAMKDLTETVLRNAIGKLTLQQVLEKKEELSDLIMEQITQPVFNWGVAVTRALIQEIFFAKDQQANLSQGAIAKKIAEAKVIQSQADVEAARLMKEASSALATEAAMQIRYVESLESIAKTGNPKYIFFPSDFREMGSTGDS